MAMAVPCMRYINWINFIRAAKKTSVIFGNVRKIHYEFPDGKEMFEEYSIETGLVVRRAWKRPRELMGEGQWELELGEPIKTLAGTGSFIVRESTTEPLLTKRITRKNIEWRISNLPYGIENYLVTADPKKNQITVRTVNKKYFKNIPVPELNRCTTAVTQKNISIHHEYNTLIITYAKPKTLYIMEIAVLGHLKNIKIQKKMDNLLVGLLAK